MQKDEGPAVSRPSSVNQEVAGSSPARGANSYNNFCSAPTDCEVALGRTSNWTATKRFDGSVGSRQDEPLAEEEVAGDAVPGLIDPLDGTTGLAPVAHEPREDKEREEGLAKD